jgi:hypothetical protein
LFPQGPTGAGGKKECNRAAGNRFLAAVVGSFILMDYSAENGFSPGCPAGENDLPEEPPRRPLRLDWVLPILIRPGKTLRAIAESEGPSWLAPVLLLSVLAIIFTLVAAPLRIQAAYSQAPELPPDAQYWSPEMVEEYLNANQPNTGPLTMYILPGLGSLLSVWGGWFILGAVLHLGLTMAGGRGSRSADFNLAAWASLPFAVRLFVQIGAMLVTRQLITAQGLSGFFPTGATGFSAYLAAIFALIDLYLFWQVALLIVGATTGARLTTPKAAGAVLGSMLLLLILQALPGFLMAQLGSLSVQRPFFF